MGTPSRDARIEAQARLLARVVRAAACWTYPGHPPRPDGSIRGQAVWHGFTSILRETLDLLDTIGAVATDERGLCRFVIDTPQVDSFSRRAIEEGADFSRVLDSFIGLFVSHRWIISSGREPFPAPADFAAEMEALACLGYAERREDEFAWTERIAPVMQHHYLWDREQVSLETRERREMEDLLLAMSPEVRSEVAACCRSHNMPRVAAIVAEQRGEPFHTGLTHMRLLCEVVAEFEQRRGPAGY